MKILHLADLHIGKKVNDFCMLKEQEFVLKQAIDLIKIQNIKAVLIAGDVFDKQVPSLGALELFDWFLNELNSLNIKVLMISGNHDNMDRLSYLSTLLEKSNIFISKSFTGKIDKVSLDEKIDVYLMPYLYPAIVKKYYTNIDIKSYNEAIKLIIDDITLDKSKFNILLAHQFVTSKNNLILSDSEQKAVGTIDEVDYKLFNKFDYTALGHLHCPQVCSTKKVQYAGSILKYSLSEINQIKKFVVLNIQAELKIEYYPIKFLHEMKQYRGYIDDFLDKSFCEKINTDDYIHFILLDEYVLEAKKKLSLIYPNILQLEFDNAFTKNLNNSINLNIASSKSLYEHFCDFYKMQIDNELDEDKKKIVQQIINEDLRGDLCAP